MGSSAALTDEVPAMAVELARALKVSETFASWLVTRELADVDEARRFLAPRLSELSSPSGMLDRAVAADRLARAVRAGERIAVFGDYDCDGITATAVLTELLRAL